MSLKLAYSARFKRDYVAAAAVVIFFAIVLAELALAVSIPSYLKRENAMALQVRRLQLRTTYDSARYFADHVKIKGGETSEMELRLVRWGLDALAPYLREYSGDLTSDEIGELDTAIKEMQRVMVRLRDKGAYSVERTLDTSVYVDSILKKTEVPQ